MGGVVEYGVGMDTKTSPRRAAIEKAQAELRQEYDVREERKRELEFLEKGGNPLDFKFGHAKSISHQSTSFIGPHSEQCAISEAKGSFALSASPHGDSIESSGRPGGSLCRDTNIADNLLLFDGENSKPCKEKNGKRRGKRVNASLLEQSSEGDGRAHAKGTEDSLVFHLGSKNQAYARRNRSRSNRDTHNNKAAVSDHSDGNRLIGESHAEDHGVSNVCDSKAASPNGNVASKISAADSKVDMEIDGADTCQTHVDKIKDGLQEAEVHISETIRNTNNPAEQLVKNEATSVDPQSMSLEPTGDVKDIRSVDRFNSSVIPENDTSNVFDDLSQINCDVDRTAEVLTPPDVEMDTLNAEKENKTAGGVDGENCDMGNNVEHGSNRLSHENPVSQRTSNDKAVMENGMSNDTELPTIATDVPKSGSSNLNNSIIQIKDEVELSDSRIGVSREVRPLANYENLKTNGEIVSKFDEQLNMGGSSHSINKGVNTSALVPAICEPSPIISKRNTSTASAAHNCAANQLKLAKKAREDAILKEARMIEANLRRAAQISTSYKYSEKRRKCHWDFVLEEMAWMANDFMQERLWKTAAAAHMCREIASTGRSKFEQEIICGKQRNVARTLAKAVMQFWHSAGSLQAAGEGSNDLNDGCSEDLSKSCKVNREAENDQAIECMEMGSIGLRPAIEAYAVRFLKYDCTISAPSVPAEAPSTPDRVKDAGIAEKSWESELSEESLFYAVPPGAMQVYRETVESQWLNYQRMVSPMNQEDCEASPCNSLPDGPRKNEYEEEEGETGSYFLPGACQVKMSTKFPLKKKKNFPQKYAMQPHNSGREFSYEACLEGKSVNRSLVFVGKRPSNNVNVGPIPTKRIRTAARQQRVVSPFPGGNSGSLQLTNKTDVSSEDTSSVQDDQSSMHGGSQSLKNMDIESTADFDKQLTCDGSETSTKSKKKSKHLGYSMNPSDSGVLKVSGKGSLFDQRFKGDSMSQHEQKDQVKKRLENQHYEPNGNFGLYGQHAPKKLKLLKQPTEPSQDLIMPANGSLSSPVVSQMSNMSNQHKFIKIIAHRDRGRKNKATKMAAGQSGSGTSWTTFEDQALVVFVHDMGPNWELVSDAINNTLQFKCIFRKPQECKERHKLLMEKSAGDGADSAEDSGTSQPYPSTLPGIPKGSARQLFQRLQGPMEEDTLKAHFEKIILIGQKLHSCRTLKDTQEVKQMTPVHSSHFVALSQTCPNNLGGGVLSPLDLCDAIASSPDVHNVGYLGSQTAGAAIPSHQGSLSPVLSTSGPNPMLQGSSGMVLGSNLSSPSSPLNAPASQRYSMPRAASLPGDDQQKMHYAQMLVNRNIQQASMSVPGAFSVGVDRGAHMLTGANGMGMMAGRPIPRPGYAGIISTGVPMVSTGSMLAGGSPCVSSPSSVHPAAVSGTGHSISRARDALHAPRPGQNTEDHRQMMMQDIQSQSSQGNGQATSPLNAASAPFSTTGIPASIHSYPAQPHQQPHQMSHVLGNHHHPHVQGVNHSSQQQAYAIRLGGLANERQLQQRTMAQSQQPYSTSSAMSPVQSSSQVQQQTQASPCSAPTHVQHSKQQMSRNPQSNPGMPSQVLKQRQQQQAHQQQPRHLQQQKQLLQQQAKLAKGLGGGTMMIHQNLPVDPSQVTGLSVASRNQVSDKNLMQQSQGFFSGPLSSNHHKLYPRPSPQSSKQMPPLPLAHSEASNQNSLLVPSNHTVLAPQQTQLPSSIPLAAASPPQQQRQINQNMQRMMLQQNRQPSSEGRVQSSGDQVNQVVLATALPRCSESSNASPLVSSAVQWKSDASHDISSPASTTHLADSPSGNLVGIDTLVPSTSDGSAQKQGPGSVSMDGHGVGGQWHPQQLPQSQPHPPQQQQQQLQHSHRLGVQGNLYPRPSDSGPG